jgi:hypothetical protein
MFDNRSPLMKRLAEIMPKKPEPQYDPKQMMKPFEMHPIRMAAESFASWMNDDLPANREELRAMLWVFGEILNGQMERMLNESMRRNSDLLATLPIKPTMIHLSEIGEVTREDMETINSAPPNPSLKFDHSSIDLTEDEIARLKNLRSEHVDSGRYSWTAGKTLKDCKMDKP